MLYTILHIYWSMKEVELTWSHILGKKLWRIRQEIWMTQEELWKKSWYSQRTISSVLWRKEKGTEDFFWKVGGVLWIKKNELWDMITEAMYEAIEQEHPEAWLWFALKTQYNISPKGVRDIMKFISHVQRSEGNTQDLIDENYEN